MAYIAHELHTRQQTSLTPRLQQSVKLLQMSTLDFNREIAQAIENNPFLEEQQELPPQETFANGYAAPDGSPAQPDAAIAVEPSPAREPENALPQTNYIEPDKSDRAASYSGDYPAARGPDRPDTDIGQWARSDTASYDLLRTDLSSYHLNERDRGLVEYIIDALDEDGYLRIAFSELADPGQFDPPVDESEWETALRLVQQLGASGLGARDLPECLSLQLNALPIGTPFRALALEIVAHGLEKVAHRDYAGLARITGRGEADVQEACGLIRTLDPRPGAHFTPVNPSNYVVPDVVVRKVGRLWVPVSNDSAIPRASLNRTYARLFREARCNDRSLMAQALQEARWFIRSLEQRSSTIQRVAEAIVARQQTFFDYGDVALRPMMLSEIADELELHESTVSRATTNKYLACPRGVFEFKYFFSRELATKSGGTCSATAVRALIQEMIVAENPREPLSDVTLALKLAHEGVVVARRTVTKYRTQIKYPPAELRRAI